jgi:FdhD protein
MWREVNGIKVPIDKVYKIYINGDFVTRIVTTPSDLDDLIIGFLYTEGYVASPDDIDHVEIGDGIIRVDLRVLRQRIPEERDVAMNIGPCSANSLSSLIYSLLSSAQQGQQLPGTSLTMEQVKALASQFSRYAIYPSMHTAALVNDGWLVVHDVSRHSAILKLVGKVIKRNALGGIVLSTGRVSSDMVTAVASIGVSTIISLRGPLYSGVETACKLGLTLIANVRGKGFLVLCDKSKIIKDANSRISLST